MAESIDAQVHDYDVDEGFPVFRVDASDFAHWNGVVGLIGANAIDETQWVAVLQLWKFFSQ